MMQIFLHLAYLKINHEYTLNLLKYYLLKKYKTVIYHRINVEMAKNRSQRA